ncbi:MAG TPA: threonylcarbamoyl-AMP synthase [Porphyromonadaceae bacterium]|nr:threonylcarbamoyl-AMP synthase [Porphyromonadaceae bacterium]
MFNAAEMSMQDDIEAAVSVLRGGGVILYPTDTVWGLGCDACNDYAVAHIFDIKRRPSAKSMLLLVSGMEMVSRHVASVPDAARSILADAKRPTTIIYDSVRSISPLLFAEDGSVGIRIPDYHFCAELCRLLGKPIVSTSANISGHPAPAAFAQIDRQIIDAADYVCETGRAGRPQMQPSDIIKVSADGTVTNIRVFDSGLDQRPKG